MAVRNFGIEHFYGDALFRDSLKSFAPTGTAAKKLAVLQELDALKNASDENRIIRYTALYNKYFSDRTSMAELGIPDNVRIPQLSELITSKLGTSNNNVLKQFVESGDVKRAIENSVTYDPTLTDFANTLTNKDERTQQPVIANFMQAWQDRKEKIEEMVKNCKTLKDFAAIRDDPTYQILKTCYGKEGIPSIMEDVMGKEGKDAVNNMQNGLKTIIERQEQLQKALLASVTNLKNAVLRGTNNQGKIPSTKVPTLLSFSFQHPQNADAFHDEAAFNDTLGRWRARFDFALNDKKNPEANFVTTLQAVHTAVTIALEKPEGKKPEIPGILAKCRDIQSELKAVAAKYEIDLPPVKMKPVETIETKEPSAPTPMHAPKRQ